MKECSACSCHVGNMHNVVAYEALNERLHSKILTSIVSFTKNVDTNFQELYDENSSR